MINIDEKGVFMNNSIICINNFLFFVILSIYNSLFIDILVVVWLVKLVIENKNIYLEIGIYLDFFLIF